MKKWTERPVAQQRRGEGGIVPLFEMCQTTKLLGIFSRLELHFCIMHETTSTTTTTMSEERTMRISKFHQYFIFLDILIVHRARRAHCKRISPRQTKHFDTEPTTYRPHNGTQSLSLQSL